MQRDEVSLNVPGSADYLRLVRLGAADAGARAGFSVDEVEDLRIAVDELCHALTDDDESCRLEVWYRTGPSAVEVEGRCEHPGAEFALSELATVIVGAVVDAYSIDFDGRARTFRFGKSATG